MAPLSPDKSPAKKMPDTDDATDNPGEWKRHPELYMPDGTMVLLTSNTVFRVYPGLLSKHSEVFRDMTCLSNCQPPNAEIYDGCPVVRLTDDPEDLAFFLATTMGLQYVLSRLLLWSIYSRSYSLISQFYINQPISFLGAAAVLRLSSKYMVEPLRRQAIAHFALIIPLSLDDIGGRPSYDFVFGNDTPHPFELVSLFHECQITPALPWAYYMACRLGVDELLNGAVHNGRAVQLTGEKSHIALKGWTVLRDDTLRIRRETVMRRSLNCTGGFCNDSMRLTWLNFIFTPETRTDPMGQWGPFESLTRSGKDKPCSECATTWLKSEKAARDKVWANLPQTFKLPPWEELENDDMSMSS